MTDDPQMRDGDKIYADAIDKQTTGLYAKFTVTRTDGQSEPGRKHDHCDYFVLDLTHDPFALPALKAYAEACRSEYPALASDLDAKLESAGLIGQAEAPPR